MSARASGHVYRVDRKRGPVWYVKYRYPDATMPSGTRQVQRKLGPAWSGKGRPPAGHFTERLAKAALRELLVDAERGTLAGMRRTGATFADAAAEYLRYVEDVRKRDSSTVDDYRGVIQGYLVDDERLAELGLKPWRDRPLEAITPDDVDAYKEALLAEGRLSNRTIVRHLTVLHGIFKRARRAYGLAANPAAAELVERPQVVYSGEFETYTRGELELLASAVEDAQDAAIYRLAWYTGLRQGELLALRWRDIDFVGGLLHVRRTYTDRREKVPKGKRVRSVPMVAEVIDELARFKEREQFTGDEDLVFCNAVGEFLDAWALRRRWERTIKRAEVRRLRFHDLRHAFGTNAIKALDAYAVQSYMGHQHYSTTQRYLHHKPRPSDAARLQAAFGESNGEVSDDEVASPDAAI